MNIQAYDRWIFTKIHEYLSKEYNKNIATRTIRNIIGYMIIDGCLDESLIIEAEKSDDKNNSILKEITGELATYLNSDAYLSYSTNIRISQGTKDKLSMLKNSPKESYEDVILRLLP